jgi:uncharacterized protein (DUF169 family)
VTVYQPIEQTLREALALGRRPIAVAYLDEPPEGVAKFEGTMPSGCSFWRLASEGRAFYTTPDDHYNCPVGSFTHNIPLPPERAAEMDRTLGLMMQIGYIKAEELGGIFRLPQTPAAVVYAPLGDTPVAPDVVVIIGRPGRLMVLQEAAIRAGAVTQPLLLGRPTCMALPAAMATGVVLSTGCIGNRVYTGAGEDELYIAVPGPRLGDVAAELSTALAANAALLDYHTARRAALASA